jgi:hypothetical protein
MPDGRPGKSTNSLRRDVGRLRHVTAEWLSELVLIAEEDSEDIFSFMEFGAEARSRRPQERKTGS